MDKLENALMLMMVLLFFVLSGAIIIEVIRELFTR